MTSKSKFYVDFPRDPSQRHSMCVVSHLEGVEDRSSKSSASTLPAEAGSVDRLTGFKEEKKPSRFFTLKPKSSFSLKPFFRSSSSSLVSLSPGKRRKDRKGVLERRDSGSQTEDDPRPEPREVGVQTLNAPTVDVPVQTSFRAWDDAGESYGQKRLAYAGRASPFWSRPYASSSVYSTAASPVSASEDPPASALVVKYATPLGSVQEASSTSLPVASSPVSASKDPPASALVVKCVTFPGSVQKASSTSLPVASTATSPVSASTDPPASALVVKFATPPGSVQKASSTSLPVASSPVSASKDPPASALVVKCATPLGSFQKASSTSLPVASTAASVNSRQLVAAAGSSADSTSEHSPAVSGSVPADVSPLHDKGRKRVEILASEKCSRFPKADDTVDGKNGDLCLKKSSTVSTADKLQDASKKESVSAGFLAPSTPVSSPDKVLEVSSDSKFESIVFEHPSVSVLKSERTDSPSKRQKTVHFDLPNPEPQSAVIQTPTKPRNIDKDFEALLRDLNAWTDDDDELKTSLQCVSPPTDSKSSTPSLTENLKSAIDCLRQDFLAPIPESSSECLEDENVYEPDSSTLPITDKGNDIASGKISPTDFNDQTATFCERDNSQKPKPSLVRTASQYDNLIHPGANVNGGVSQVLENASFTSNSGTTSENDALEGNVYDNVIKEENSVQTAALPTPPSFFEPPSPQVSETAEDADENSFSERPACFEERGPMPIVDPAFERGRTSRSSSRSSVISNSKSGMDGSDQLSKFDSCENLGQLEEEIIRSLYSPDEEAIMKNIDLPESESFQNSGTAATLMRRVILDQLLSGKSVQDILPEPANQQVTKPAAAVTRRSHKPPRKYQAVITRLEAADNCDEIAAVATGNVICPGVGVMCELPEKRDHNSEVQKTESPRKTSVFLFPEMDLTSQRVPEKSDVEVPGSRGPSALGVRRSSRTAQATPDSTKSSAFTSLESGSPCDNKPNHCDYTNCLKPSEIQSSPFLAKINTRSMSPCNVPPAPSVKLTASCSSQIRGEGSPVKQPSSTGECDYGSCLRPSEVQNSMFTKELSEITSGNSVHSLRSGSPVTFRTSSPSTIRRFNQECPLPSPVPIEVKRISSESAPEPVKHKSELLITLQPSKDQGDGSTKPEPAKSNVEIPMPPPPPPPPLPSQNLKYVSERVVTPVVKHLDRNEKPNSNPVESTSKVSTCPMSPMKSELEIKLQAREINATRCNDGDETGAFRDSRESIEEDGKFDNSNGSLGQFNGHQTQNGNIRILSDHEYLSGPEVKGKNGDISQTLTYPPKTVITDEPPPPGAVLLDKKVIVDGDKIHTDKYYAIPMKEVIKEKTSTTKFIPAPPKYEGIGPTEDGVPIGLRNSVKKENMHNWYKSMFKSLHKADSSNDDSQEYIIGYTSEPESSKKDIIVRKKSSTLDNRQKHDLNSNYPKPYPAAKSSIEVYNVWPRSIEDYEPGYSSVTDDEVVTSRRYLPSLNTPKPSYVFKNGYESDTSLTRKSDQPTPLSPDQQKRWYREIQKGSEIPHFGLGKPAPEKPFDPVIGPLPPPPLNYNGPVSPQPGVRPSSLPAGYSNQNGSSYCQQMNGAYEVQMRQALHSEMQQRRSPPSNQLSLPIRTPTKSPSRSPDLKIPAQALFDFKAESPKELPLKKGDLVLLLRQLDKNWYEGEHKGRIGIFPISYVEIVPPEHVSAPLQPKKEGVGRALYDFVAKSSVELTVRKGETIILLRRVDSNWFEAILNKKKGIVPISYIQVLQEPVEKSALSSPLSSPASPSPINREKAPSVNLLSTSVHSSATSSPMPLNSILKNAGSPERQKITSKKSSNLVEPAMYRALYSYSPQNADELELEEGDSVYVVEMCDDGWFVGTSVRTGTFGIFPGNYVEKAS